MQTSDTSSSILQEAILCDNQFAIEVAMPFDFEKKWEFVDRYANAGFSCVSLSLANQENTTEMTLSYLARILHYLSLHPQKYILAKTAADITRAKQEKKLAIRLMFQGAPINQDLNMISLYFQLGITSMIISYNIRTPLGNGCIEANDDGLSFLGKAFIKEMNRVGMLIDCSHTGYRTTMDTFECSQQPVVVSHAGAYGVHPIPRNLKDDQLKALAKTGGFIGVDGISVILGQAKASVEKLVEHIDYIAQLIGPEYIALGLDYLYFPNEFAEFSKNQPVTNPPLYVKMTTANPILTSIAPEQIQALIQLLLNKGYTVATIRGILGENCLRVIQKVNG